MFSYSILGDFFGGSQICAIIRINGFTKSISEFFFSALAGSDRDSSFNRSECFFEMNIRAPIAYFSILMKQIQLRYYLKILVIGAI